MGFSTPNSQALSMRRTTGGVIQIRRITQRVWWIPLRLKQARSRRTNVGCSFAATTRIARVVLPLTQPLLGKRLGNGRETFRLKIDLRLRVEPTPVPLLRVTGVGGS